MLVEKPFIKFTDNFDLLMRFALLSDEEKQLVLLMQHLSSPREARSQLSVDHLESIDEVLTLILSHLSKTSTPLSTKLLAIPRVDLFRVLCVAAFNSHSFPSQQTPSVDNPDISVTTESAIFQLASRVTHSCSPNTVYSSRFSPGSLTYFAVRPLLPGEMVTFSYVGCLPTAARRAELLRTKDFYCACDKCAGFDHFSGLRCPGRLCGGITLRRRASEDSDTTWLCQLCRSDAVPDADVEEQFEERLEALRASYCTGEAMFYSQYAVTQLRSLAEAAVEELSPTHHLVATAREHTARLLGAGLDQLQARLPAAPLEKRLRCSTSTGGRRKRL